MKPEQKVKSTETRNAEPIRVGLISLGCAKNLVDAEIMLGSLLKDGIQITNEASEADVVIVNTCSFIESAQQESIDAILESDELRNQRKPHQGLIVSGCLPQRFRDELPTLLPEVDAFMGIDQVAQAPQIVRAALELRRTKTKANVEHPTSNVQGSKKKRTLPFKPEQEASAPLIEVNARPIYVQDFETPRFRLTPKHFAYVKIAEGCNHPCTFCIIPRMRGSHRSRTQADVVAEAKALVADGVKELNLISQDSTYYGLDLRANHSRAISSPEKFSAAAHYRWLPTDATTLCTLLRELNKIPGNFWIRLLYTHPAHWTDELIKTIAECPKVARYIDIPLQHIHGNMLERMRRETSQQYIVDLIAKIRASGDIPGIAIRHDEIYRRIPRRNGCVFPNIARFLFATTRFERLSWRIYLLATGRHARWKKDGRTDSRTRLSFSARNLRWPSSKKLRVKFRNHSSAAN